ncbi:SusC/RagA family TonB-linked outer membrane protein [Dinghuibacter silviterrae]|uniref:TonB-linked SusC/RagA family outer membrane protein n=1 Tax=Dinghuibacter silviterrae TaxID=1539049 RepID=A0A4R8DGT1_9BACT|nr:SusC/RagA family TonB-linked outer membrane protein [Dinghuibacter silviterrae]TDW96889.1 TonB-linked SusC/RagA family outer membrane protein [Dinghuibacter silviterrae]
MRKMLVLFLALSVLAAAASAQTRKISGKVTAAGTNEPLAGVTVQVKGADAGTRTNAEGAFTLTVRDNVKTLVLTSVGYTSQEISVGANDFVTVSLQLATRSLNEVVVVGYGTLKREEITSAVASVKPEDFNQGGARNALDLIQGKVAGLEITRTGGTNPNTGVSIQLRSATSLTGSISPLVIVDGIPGGNLDLLQQDDIASIDVLKDGSAAAIYGTQANGGVIIVTTKKGHAGPPRFDYSTYFRKDFVWRKPDFMTAAQYRQRALSGLYPNLTPIYTEGQYSANTDMFDSLVNKDNLTQYHNLSMSGGTENTSYRASIYYSDLEGIAQANSRRQYGARFSIDQKGMGGRMTGHVDLVTNFNKANLEGGGQWQEALSRIPTLPIHDSTGAFYTSKLTSNPISDIAQTTYLRDQSTNSADASLGLEVYKGLKVAAFGSVMRDSYNDNEYEDLNSDASLYNGTYPGGGYAYQGNTVVTDYAFTPTVEYNHEFGVSHHVNAVAGYNYQYHTETDISMSNQGFINDVTTDNNIGIGQALADGKASEYSYKEAEILIAFFGRVNYSYLDRYFFQASLRHEGSSKFGANHKWGDFPAVSAGWDITREVFMRHTRIFTDLKLRAGYGVTGNSGIAPYQSLVTLTTGGQYAYPDGVYRQTYGPGNNPNPNLKWEKKAETNVGVDFSLLNARLTGSVDVFYRKTTDLLYNYTTQLPPYVQSSIYTNVGSMSSKGIELTLGGTVIKQRDFTWKMDVTGSYTTNKMISFSNSLYQFSHLDLGGISGPGALGNALRIDQGGAIGNFYGKRFAGFDTSGHWLFYKADGKTKVPLSGITQSDYTILGNGIPKYILSWTNSFVYKNWDLRIFFRGRFKYKILNTMDLDYGNKFTLPGNVLNSAFGKYNQLNDTYEYSDYYLQPGGFLKLDNVTVGYTFRIRTPLIRSLRLYASGSNLAIITKYKGNDPDFVEDTGLTTGIDSQNAYPDTRSFLLGLNLGF